MAKLILKNRSPNAPSKPLDWAVSSSQNILNKEGNHALPPDIVANSLGYKDSGSGPARQAIATLKSYGMLDKEGSKLRLSQSVQRFKLALTEDGKNAILQEWFMSPPLFSELLNKYGSTLPSDPVLIHDLVLEKNFTEKAAKKVVENLRSSIEYAHLDSNMPEKLEEHATNQPTTSVEQIGETIITSQLQPPTQALVSNTVRYPVRLAGGRMAHIEVPENFYNKDKEKLQAQLSIIGTLDEDEGNESFL